MSLTQVPWLEYLKQLRSLIEAAGAGRILGTTACMYAAYKLFYALYLSPLRNIPGPFLARLTGRRAEVFGAIGAQARKALEEYEAYGDVYVYQPNSVSISNPADVRAVFGSHEFRKSEFYKTLSVLDVDNTNSATDPQFASMRRRQIGPYFSNSYLAKMEKAILAHGIVSIKEKWDELLEASENGHIEVNYHKTFLYATFDTIGHLSFGREFGTLKNDDSTVSKWLRGTLMYIGSRTMFPLLKFFPFSLLLAPYAHVFSELANYSAECIATRRELLAELEAAGGLEKKPADLLQGFIDAVDHESKMRMTPREVHAESILMLVASSETTTSTLLTIIYLLMLYPQCYKKVVEEVRSAFDKNHLITYSEGKAHLPYLEACIYESMRLFSVTGGQWPRIAPKQGLTLSSGHFIPGGTEINVNIAGANMNKEYWNEPHLFDPTRFIGNEEAKRNMFSFSYGVRVCPGRQLAWIEMLTILANILKDYDLRLPDDYTLHGPNVLNDKGYPKLMEMAHFFSSSPVNAERDCRIIVTKRS